MFDLTGKVAIVTGGVGHLGSAISEGLAKAGASVVIASRDKEKCERLATEIREKCPKSFAIGTELDVSCQECIEACFKRVNKGFGKIDILVNNAMNWGNKDFNKGLQMAVGTIYDCSVAVLPYMKQGTIINIASMYGMISDHPDIYPKKSQQSPAYYFAGKGGIITLTKWFACHYPNIRTNCVSYGAFPKVKDEKLIQKLSEQIPMGRIGQPSEAAGAVVFLASDEASYITGHNLVVDGGWTAW